MIWSFPIFKKWLILSSGKSCKNISFNISEALLKSGDQELGEDNIFATKESSFLCPGIIKSRFQHCCQIKCLCRSKSCMAFPRHSVLPLMGAMPLRDDVHPGGSLRSSASTLMLAFCTFLGKQWKKISCQNYQNLLPQLGMEAMKGQGN